MVPRSSLVAEGRRWHLYRVNDDDTTVEQLEVKIGFESGDRIEIAELVNGSSKLVSGQEVVIKGAPALSDGATIRTVNDEKEAENEEQPEEAGDQEAENSTGEGA